MSQTNIIRYAHKHRMEGMAVTLNMERQTCMKVCTHLKRGHKICLNESGGHDRVHGVGPGDKHATGTGARNGVEEGGGAFHTAGRLPCSAMSFA